LAISTNIFVAFGAALGGVNLDGGANFIHGKIEDGTSVNRSINTPYFENSSTKARGLFEQKLRCISNYRIEPFLNFGEINYWDEM